MNILWYIAIAFVLALVSAVILNLLGRTKRFGKIFGSKASPSTKSARWGR